MSQTIVMLHDPLRGRRRNESESAGETTVTLQASRPVTAAWVRSEPDNEEFLSLLAARGRQGRWFVYEDELRLNPADEVTRYAFKMLLQRRRYG